MEEYWKITNESFGLFKFCDFISDFFCTLKTNFVSYNKMVRLNCETNGCFLQQISFLVLNKTIKTKSASFSFNIASSLL